MQKVEGSNPFSRFPEIPLPSGISSFWGRAAFGYVGLRSGRGSAQWPDDWPDGTNFGPVQQFDRAGVLFATVELNNPKVARSDPAPLSQARAEKTAPRGGFALLGQVKIAGAVDDRTDRI